jgi:hypothetical protein
MAKGTDEPKPFSGDEHQFRRFVETARDLECDEDERAFEEKVRKVAEERARQKRKDKGR